MTAVERADIPIIDAASAPYWEAARQGRLLIAECGSCAKVHHYPRPFCPHCFSEDVAWVRVSGRATLHSYVINHRPMPGWEDDGPYAIALVELVAVRGRDEQDMTHARIVSPAVSRAPA